MCVGNFNWIIHTKSEFVFLYIRNLKNERLKNFENEITLWIFLRCEFIKIILKLFAIQIHLNILRSKRNIHNLRVKHYQLKFRTINNYHANWHLLYIFTKYTPCLPSFYATKYTVIMLSTKWKLFHYQNFEKKNSTCLIIYQDAVHLPKIYNLLTRQKIQTMHVSNKDSPKKNLY